MKTAGFRSWFRPGSHLTVRAAATVVALVIGTAGCIDTDPAVFVDATIDDPAVEIEASALGVSMTGQFQVRLHLGARASGQSEVTFETFNLLNETGDVIVESLPLTSDAAGAVTVEPGGADTVVQFTLNTGANVLPAEVADAICAGEVSIAGVVNDSLSTTATPVESEPFLVDGC